MSTDGEWVLFSSLAGDLVNIDVSGVKNGLFGDTGSSFIVPPAKPKIEKLLRDGKRAPILSPEHEGDAPHRFVARTPSP